MAKKHDHIHKLERRELGKHTVFKCLVSGCTFFLRSELAEGRICICWRCNNPMVLTKLAMKYKRPHCADCIRTKTKTTPKAKLDRLSELLSSSDMLSKIRS